MRSNSYVLIFAVVTTIIAAVLLATAATLLKPNQDANILKEKQKNILKVVGIVPDEKQVAEIFNQKIESKVVDAEGNEVTTVEAFNVDLITEKKLKSKNPNHKLNYPIYIFTEDNGDKKYILQLSGVGLWGPVWGYLALDSDGKTIASAIFDHKGETPGLGAEISTEAFAKQFTNLDAIDDQGNVPVKVVKNGTEQNYENRVDGISGGTITSIGVSNMLQQDIKFYMPYLQKQNKNS